MFLPFYGKFGDVFMMCLCGGYYHVMDTAKAPEVIGRRRKCDRCGDIIHTVEILDFDDVAKFLLYMKSKKYAMHKN